MKKTISLQNSLSATNPEIFHKFDGCSDTECLKRLVCHKIRSGKPVEGCLMENRDENFLKMLMLYINTGSDVVYP